MTEDKLHSCPFFPDLECPQGKEASESCQVRLSGNFDPITDFRDHLLMECAIYRNYQEKESKNKTDQED